MILGNGNFYVFSFSNWANVFLVMDIKPLVLLSFHPILNLHPASLIFPPLFQLVGHHTSGESRFYPPPCLGFLSIFAFSLWSGWRPCDSPFIWQIPLIHPPVRLVSLLHSSSQYLPVLSKCYCKVFQWDDSKYVYINRGNTLGYILLTPCVASSLHISIWSDLTQNTSRGSTWFMKHTQIKNSQRAGAQVSTWSLLLNCVCFVEL